MESLTTKVDTYKAQLYGKDVWFVDTPGFDDSHGEGMSDTEILRTISEELVKQHKQGQKANGLIYLHSITEDKMRSSNKRNLELFKGVVGREALKNVVLATTKWDKVTVVDGSAKEILLRTKYWSDMEQLGSKVFRIDPRDRDSYLAVVRELMKNNGVDLQIQTELGSGVPLEQTAAGKVVSEAVNKAIEKLQEELKATRESAQEERMNLQLELQNQLQKAERDRELLKQNIQDLRRELTQPPPPPPPLPYQPPAPQIDRRAEYNNFRDQGIAFFQRNQMKPAQAHLLEAYSHAKRYFGDNDPDTEEAGNNIDSIRVYVGSLIDYS